MEEELPEHMTESSRVPPVPGQSSHTLAAPVLHFDLRHEMDQLRQLDTYRHGSPAGRTLVKEPDLRIVLMALKAGARLEEHRASGPISIQALEGTIRLRLREDSIELAQGELLMIEPAIPHDVEAVANAVFLLTIGPTTYQQVSDHHEPHA